MKYVNLVLNTLFDVFLYPLGWLPPLWGLIFVSAVSGILMVMIFGKISDQEGIAVLRKRMTGEVLGILLNAGTPATVISFAARLIADNTRYLVMILKPMVVMAVPFMLLWGQLDARYGSAGLPGNQPVTITFQYAEEPPPTEENDFSVRNGGLIPPVMTVDTLKQVSFRIFSHGSRGVEILANDLRIPVGSIHEWNGSLVSRGFDTSPSLLSPFHPTVTVLDAGTETPDSGWYSFPDVDYRVMGWRWSWAAVFLVFSMAAAVVATGVLKIKV